MKNKITELINDYRVDEDLFTDDEDYMIQLKKALNNLSDADKIIFVMYCESGSLRKVGKELGVSHTIVYKQVQRIKKQMYDYIKLNFNGNNNLLLDRFKRICNFI